MKSKYVVIICISILLMCAFGAGFSLGNMVCNDFYERLEQYEK